MEQLFNVEEEYLIQVYPNGNRVKLMESIQSVLPHIQDPDMTELCQKMLTKLASLTDDAYKLWFMHFVAETDD